MTKAEARFNNSLRPRKPEGSLGRTAQDVHLDSHTAHELWLNVHRNYQLIRDGEKKGVLEKGGGGGGEKEIIYLLLHCHRQDDACIKMGSD